MAKKTNTKKSTKKEVDINDVNSLVEDVKKLALEKPKTEKKETVTETVKDSKIDKVEEVVKEQETPTKELKTYEEPVTTVTPNKNTDEDLSFIDEVKAEEAVVEETKQEKPKRKITYQEMFGGTWMGYGYSE